MTPFRVTQRTQDAVWASLGEYDLRAELQALPALPALVVAGEDDPMPLDAARELAALLHARLVELPTGHAPHVEATNELMAVLGDFLPRG